MNEQLNKVKAYYKATRWDYRWVWGVRHTYAIHFGYYDETATHHKAAVANMNRVMAEMAGIEAKDKVLDAGCGVGGSGIWLAQELGCKVTGITPVEEQIRDARKNALQQGLSDQVNFVQADYCHTPFEDHSFDVIWALESVCHAPQKLNFYKEAHRLLKPGGRLIIAEYFRRYRPLSLDQESLLQRWLHGWAIPDIDTLQEHRQHTLAVGFSHIAHQEITAHVEQSVRNIREHADKWLWAAKLLNKTGIVSDVQVRNVQGSAAMWDALEAGLWGYGLLLVGPISGKL